MRELLVVSHCDDAELFMPNRVFDDDRTYGLFVASSDQNSRERSWCAKRRFAQADICKLLGVEWLRILDWDSEHYKLPMRPDNKLKTFSDQVVNVIRECDPEIIWTFSPYGAYGHLDHRLLHHIVMESGLGKEIHCTDIRQYANWPVGEADVLADVYFRGWEKTGEYTMPAKHKVLFDACKNIYDKYGCWTWSRDVVEQFNTYRFVR